MARIALLTSNIAGRMNASIEVARKLQAAGHEITFITDLDEGETPIDTPGRHVPLPRSQVPAGEPSARSSTPGPRWWALMKRLALVHDLARRRRERVRQLNPQAIVHLLADLSPNLILIDIEMPVEIMAARSSGIRVAVFNDMYSVWRRPGLPPLSSDIVPGRGWRGTRYGIALSWWWFRTWKLLQRIRFRITRVGVDRRSILEEVAREVGFDLSDETSTSHWLIPFVYERIPTLTLNALEIEFPHDIAPSVTYVGPQIPPSSRDRSSVALVGDPLSDVLKRCEDDPNRFLIYCAFGAFGGSNLSMLDQVMEAVGGREDWELVVGLGGRSHRGVISAPSNVHVYDWAPQIEVLRRADCAIHHAGTHTVNECIDAQVPMLVYPDDKLDHRGNAARVSYHGLGVVGDLRRDTPEIVRSRIETCLTSDEMKQNLAAMAASFRAYKETRALEVAVERLIRV